MKHPSVAMMDLIAGGFVSQGLATAAELGIADHLGAGPRSSDAIARTLGAHAPSVYRLMRMLAAVGVLAEHEGHVFELTPIGECLCSDNPGSLAPMARFMGGRAHGAAWAELAHAVRTGESAFRRAHGREAFDWLAEHPDAAAIFSDAMTSISSTAAGAIVAAYDFSSFAAIADIGGGHGLLLLRILDASPRTHGALFDRPHVIEAARKHLGDHLSGGRCTMVAGNFFESVPADCDAYLLKCVLHDWSDDSCVSILKNCALGLKDAGRVLVIEQVLTPPGEPSFAKLLDVEMLVMTDGGRERTREEYGALFAAAGLRLTRVVTTESPMQVIEAVSA